MVEQKRSRIGRVTFRPEQLDLDLQDILKDFYLPEDVNLVLNIPLVWDSSLKKWKIAAIGGATEETLTLLARETTLSNIYNQLYNFLGGHRFKNMWAESGSVSVPPNTTVTWLTVSGIGYFILFHYMYSSGIPASNAVHFILCDGVLDKEGYLPNINEAAAFGFNAVGNYTCGHKGFRVHIWDTTNNIFDIFHLARASKTPFRTKLEARFYNSHSTATATMQGAVQCCIYVASKRNIFKLPSMIDPVSLKRKMQSEKVNVSAIIVQLLGYFEDESTHPYHEFLNHLPNTPASKNKPHVVCEVYSSEEVSIDKIAQHIKPEKAIYEEVI